MWFLITTILLVLPIMMRAMGQCFVRVRPQSKRCRIYYRTERSMKNDTTTRFAHQVCGKFYMWAGKWSLLITIGLSIAFFRLPIASYETACGIWLMCETVLLLFGVPLTERALSHRFGRNLI
ncbi:MAG: SdpI family protein [Lachnospiraceae bacterium]|nr:SdpI family protein [Lachnospiraceae bacterium]